MYICIWLHGTFKLKCSNYTPFYLLHPNLLGNGVTSRSQMNQCGCRGGKTGKIWEGIKPNKGWLLGEVWRKWHSVVIIWVDRGRICAENRRQDKKIWVLNLNIRELLNKWRKLLQKKWREQQREVEQEFPGIDREMKRSTESLFTQEAGAIEGKSGKVIFLNPFFANDSWGICKIWTF